MPEYLTPSNAGTCEVQEIAILDSKDAFPRSHRMAVSKHPEGKIYFKDKEIHEIKNIKFASDGRICIQVFGIQRGIVLDSVQFRYICEQYLKMKKTGFIKNE